MNVTEHNLLPLGEITEISAAKPAILANIFAAKLSMPGLDPLNCALIAAHDAANIKFHESIPIEQTTPVSRATLLDGVLKELSLLEIVEMKRQLVGNVKIPILPPDLPIALAPVAERVDKIFRLANSPPDPAEITQKLAEYRQYLQTALEISATDNIPLIDEPTKIVIQTYLASLPPESVAEK